MRDRVLTQHKRLDRLAKHIRSIYIAERRRQAVLRGYHSRPYVPGRHWDGDGKREAIWPQLALWSIQHELEPQLLVRAVFAARTDIMPEPNMLKGERALELYNHYRERYYELLQRSFDSQRRSVVVETTKLRVQYGDKWDQARIYEAVIGDPNLELTALFRYCLACAARRKDLASRYYTAAVLQYVPCRDFYERVWKHWLPAKFVDRAPQEYRRLLCGVD